LLKDDLAFHTAMKSQKKNIKYDVLGKFTMNTNSSKRKHIEYRDLTDQLVESF
jgi:hypothetical protein